MESMSAAAWAAGGNTEGLGTGMRERCGVRKRSKPNWSDGSTTAVIYCKSLNFLITLDRFHSVITGVKFYLHKATQVGIQKHCHVNLQYDQASSAENKLFLKNQLVLSYPIQLS